MAVPTPIVWGPRASMTLILLEKSLLYLLHHLLQKSKQLLKKRCVLITNTHSPCLFAVRKSHKKRRVKRRRQADEGGMITALSSVHFLRWFPRLILVLGTQMYLRYRISQYRVLLVSVCVCERCCMYAIGYVVSFHSLYPYPFYNSFPFLLQVLEGNVLPLQSLHLLEKSGLLWVLKWVIFSHCIECQCTSLSLSFFPAAQCWGGDGG